MYWKQNTNLSVLSGQITAGWQCVREMWRSCPGLLDGDGRGGGGGGGREEGRQRGEGEWKSTNPVTGWPLALCTWRWSAASPVSAPSCQLWPTSTRRVVLVSHALSLWVTSLRVPPPPLISPFHTSGRLSAAVRTDLFTLLDTKVGNYDQNSLVWRRKMAALIHHIVNYLLSGDITATILVFFPPLISSYDSFFIWTNSKNPFHPPKNT